MKRFCSLQWHWSLAWEPIAPETAHHYLKEYLSTLKNYTSSEKAGLKTKTTVYDISKISKFRHLAKPELSKHPLAGETFDYLGFQTEQQVINEMHGDNRLAFEYEGKLVTFGENVYSWDFEQLQVLLYDITGNDLRYDDEFEKNFKPEDNGHEAGI